MNIEFWGYTHFSNNTSTALMVDIATTELRNNSVTSFQDNSGLYGGAILLIEGASIIVYPNSTVIFIRNTAVEHGGTIYVELSTPFDYLLSHVCFVRYYSETTLPAIEELYLQLSRLYYGKVLSHLFPLYYGKVLSHLLFSHAQGRIQDFYHGVSISKKLQEYIWN